MEIGDALGHLYPAIDNTKCVDCGLCKKVCPSNHQQTKSTPTLAYAGWDKNEDEYKSSTSGGAASALSRYIIRQGGVVYGCEMSLDLDVRHIRVENEEDIIKLKGSKYVQSSIRECLKDIKKELRQGKKVLFIGTPCQVAAVKSVVGNNDSNLYTVDLICHGVPSLNFLEVM